jgi:hypothetical protein
VRTLGAVVALALWCVPRTSRAQEGVAFTWSAPAACPTRDEVLDRALRLRPTLARGGVALRATATVTPAARGRWRVRVRTEAGGAAGERSLEGRTCALLADATAVVLALAYDALPSAPPAADHPALPESVEQVDDPESALPRPVVIPPPPAAPRRWYDLGLGVAVDPLSFASPAVSIGVHGALDRGALRVELALAQTLPTTLAGARAGTGAELLAATLTARACVMRVRPVALGLCGVGTVGVMWGAAFGLQRNDTAAWPWAAAGGGAALRVGPRGGRFAAIAHLEAVAHLTRPRFVVEGVGVTGEVPAVALVAALGVEARWP